MIFVQINSLGIINLCDRKVTGVQEVETQSFQIVEVFQVHNYVILSSLQVPRSLGFIS
jgi:hypothetical protein